ncbi:MAG: hypothetical protein IKS87_08455, partial [Lachnospiraceae bacterium]|nr:hypothetical protein [Lachnospiraceae bacterium]
MDNKMKSMDNKMKSMDNKIDKLAVKESEHHDDVMNHLARHEEWLIRIDKHLEQIDGDLRSVHATLRERWGIPDMKKRLGAVEHTVQKQSKKIRLLELK